MDVVSGQPAYLLHARPYRETSRILELFTPEHGRVAAVQRGARDRRQRGGAAAQFQHLQVGWSGRGNLKSLRMVESTGRPRLLAGDRLASGLYLNELLIRVLRPHDAHEALFAAYAEAVAGLDAGAELQPLLRRFETILLQEIGYGLSFAHCADSGEPIRREGFYGFAADSGFQPAAIAGERWPGHVLLAIGQGDYATAEVRVAAKRILRLALQPHLGDRPLRSRELLHTTHGDDQQLRR